MMLPRGLHVTGRAARGARRICPLHLHGLDVGSLRIYNDCDGCHRGKAINDKKFKTWKFFEPPVIHAVPKKSLRVVQMDWCGPFRTRGIGG